jgi:hypothetical protein
MNTAQRIAEPLIKVLDEGRHIEELSLYGRDVPVVALETEPGDIHVFSNYRKQVPFGGGNCHRMLVFYFLQCVPVEYQEDLTSIG